MKLSFKFSIELTRDTDTSSDETAAGIGAGETHNFDRDTTPASPDDRYNWEPEDRRLGFR